MAELIFNATDTEIRFNSYDEVSDWLRDERDRWNWATAHAGDVAQPAADTISRSFSQLQEVDGTRNRSDLNVSHLQGVFAQAYNRANNQLIYSGSRLGSQLIDMAQAISQPVARYAYAFSIQTVTLAQATTIDHLKGVLGLVLPGGFDPELYADRMQKERHNFRQAIAATERRADAELAAQRDRWARDRSRLSRFFVAIVRQRDQLWKTAWAAAQDQSEKAVISIQSTENLYKEAMKLQAPVAYWRDKAKTHGDAEAIAVTRLTRFFIAAVIVLGGTFFGAAKFILTETVSDATHPSAPVALYVVVSGGLATVSALIFWIGRILTKLYLSEHHLRHDAEERAVMTTTYLALGAEDAASEQDRQIILSALFRTSSDGIVKDDGPADLAGLASLLSRLGIK